MFQTSRFSLILETHFLCLFISVEATRFSGKIKIKNLLLFGCNLDKLDHTPCWPESRSQSSWIAPTCWPSPAHRGQGWRSSSAPSPVPCLLWDTRHGYKPQSNVLYWHWYLWYRNSMTINREEMKRGTGRDWNISSVFILYFNDSFGQHDWTPNDLLMSVLVNWYGVGFPSCDGIHIL